MISHVAKVAGIDSKSISKCGTGTECTNNNNKHTTRGKHNNTYSKLKFAPNQIKSIPIFTFDIFICKLCTV